VVKNKESKDPKNKAGFAASFAVKFQISLASFRSRKFNWRNFPSTHSRVVIRLAAITNEKPNAHHPSRVVTPHPDQCLQT
jgi:hypothetical protein